MTAWHLDYYATEALLKTAVLALSPSATQVNVGRFPPAGDYWVLYLL